MKIILLSGLLILSLHGISAAQSIVGKWQLSRQTTCMDEEVSDPDSDELVSEMKAMSSPARHVLHLKGNNTLEETTRIINSRKSYNAKNLLYKFSGNALYILDKRSKTIIESFTVEQLSTDTLILSNTARACETKVFIKID